MAVSLLCEIIAQGSKASAASFRRRAGYDALIQAGLCHETGTVQSLVCDECNEPHDAEIVFDAGRYGYFCPEIGFVPVEQSKLAGLKPDLGKLVDLLADTFDCKRRKATPVHGLTWRVGSVDTVAGDLTLYFHPRLRSGGDVYAIEDALRREVMSSYRLILTADNAVPVFGVKTAQLNDVVELDTKTGAFVTITDPRAIVEVPMENPGGRPNLFGDKLADIALSRMQNGQTLTGRNKEARAVLDDFCAQFPNEKPPSLPTVKRHLTKIRGGS